MSEFTKAIKLANEEGKDLQRLEIDRLTQLVESQISNVIGGGYSQYAAWHSSDAS
jgi:hypothetical protein